MGRKKTKGDPIVMGLLDSALIIREDGGLEMHLARGGDPDDMNAPVPNSAIAIAKLAVGLQDERVRNLIDEIFDKGVNSVLEEENEDSSEGC